MKGAKRKTNPTALDEYDWADLFAKFREHPHDPHVANVIRVLELLKALTPVVRGARGARLQSELNMRMKDYQWQSLVSPSRQGVIEVLRSPIGVTGTKKWEWDAVRWLLNLLRSRGELDLVHLCEMNKERSECAGWFYGRPNKRFCSAACKQYHYDTQEEVKARRTRNAGYNLAYRRNLKRQEAADKKKVGFRGEYRHRAKKDVGTGQARTGTK